MIKVVPRLDDLEETCARIKRALTKIGWATHTPLIKEAYKFLQKEGDPSKLQYKVIRAKLKDFKPQVMPEINPSPERKYIDLLILASALSLEVAIEAKDKKRTEKLEMLIRRAASKLTLPADHYARAVAIRYDIAFGEKLFDCFGFWERNNRYCTRCLDRNKCFEFVKQVSLGGLVNPAIETFKVPEELRESEPLRALQMEKSTSEGTLAASIDRKSLLTWIGQEFHTLSRIDYTESTSFQISHPYRKKMVLLKVDKFTTRSYNVIFNVISDQQAAEFELAKVRGNWVHTEPDVLKIQDEIRKYLAVALHIPALSTVLSKEEEIKQEIQQRLVAEWTGVLESRADHDVFIDSRRQKILRFARVPNKGFRLDFSRWGREKAAEFGLKYTSSGARYEGSDREELEKLLNTYLHSIKSSYFGQRHTVLTDSPFS